MGDPATREEYDRLAKANARVEGFGVDVTMHLPCPFCSAPDFMSYKILEAARAWQKPHTCSSCARSLGVEADGATFEFVQTGGPPQPAYLPPMRRVNP